MQCPFVYANGRRCRGEVEAARARPRIGGDFHQVKLEDIHKVVLRCSLKGSHAGVVNWYEGEYRMGFTPDELRHRGIWEEVLALCRNLAFRWSGLRRLLVVDQEVCR